MNKDLQPSSFKPNNSILFSNSCTNDNTISKRLQLHTNPPMRFVHSIYPTTPQGHSIPTYTSSLHRPYITSLLHRFQGDSPSTAIHDHTRAHLMRGHSFPHIRHSLQWQFGRAMLLQWFGRSSQLVRDQWIRRIPLASICDIYQPIRVANRYHRQGWVEAQPTTFVE